MQTFITKKVGFWAYFKYFMSVSDESSQQKLHFRQDQPGAVKMSKFHSSLKSG